MAENNAYKFLNYVIENNTGMIYGDSGTGKSQFVLAVMRQAVDIDKKVIYCDTEGNQDATATKWLSANTKVFKFSDFDDVHKWSQGLPVKSDLVVLDSLGLPCLGAFASANARERGTMLLKAASIGYSLMKYCDKNNAMALIVNQPVSEMTMANKGGQSEVLNPFGGKARFFMKEIIRTELAAPAGLITSVNLIVHRSRHMPTGHKLAEMKISTGGVHIAFNNYVGSKGKDLAPITVSIKNGQTQPEDESEEPPKPKRKKKEDPPKEEPEATTEEPEKPSETNEVDDATQSSDDADDAAEKTRALLDERIAKIKAEIKTLMKDGGISDGIFEAMCFAEEVKDVKTPDDIKDIADADVIKLAIENQVKAKANSKLEDQPSGLFDDSEDE